MVLVRKWSCRILAYLRKFCGVFNQNYRGGVLIEFAFSIPVCIILLFFACDHYRFFELRNKVRTSSFLLASMLQNYGNVKNTKELTIDSMKSLIVVSAYNFFHTGSMFYPYPFGLSWAGTISYVKKLSADSYYLQQYNLDTNIGDTDSRNLPRLADRITCTRSSGKNINTIQLLDISEDLAIDKVNGEKIVIDVAFKAVGDKGDSPIGAMFGGNVPTENNQQNTTTNTVQNENQNNQTINNYFNKGKLGLFILNARNGNFRNVVIVTPKPGLFRQN